MTDTIRPTLGAIIDISLKITGKGKIGSALEAYEIRLLWDLGDLLQIYCADRPFYAVLDAIEKGLVVSKRGKFDSRLYRGALAIRNYWANKGDYSNAIKSLNSWGKLREIVPLLEIVLKLDAKLVRHDIDELVRQAHGRTYPDVRDLVKALRLKGDPIFEELGIDIHELQKELYHITEDLARYLEGNDGGFYSAFRQAFDEKSILAIRKCLSGLQSDEVYQKYKREIREFSCHPLPIQPNPEFALLSKLVGDIARLAVSEAGRKRVREEVGIRLFGDLSTYLKALSSDENRERFLKNQEVLKTFLGGMQS